MAKILVAEDERDIRELIGFTLRYHGHEVISANNGAEALEMARKSVPDLFLLDVRMPRLSGYEVCEQIKNDPVLNQVPVVFLSAKGQEAEIQAGLAAGAAAYILKPFLPDELVQQLEAVLASRPPAPPAA
jgi:two-component system alkaline phosphatase synthesis response regulator PhoP